MKQHPKLFDLENPNEWIDHQVKRDKISDRAFRSMVQKLARAMYHNCDLVVRPEQALLLYPQCTAGSTQSAQKESRGPGFVKKRFLEYSDWSRVDKGHWRVTFGKYRPRHSVPRHPEKTSFRYAASLIEWPFTSLASWKLFHLYSGEIPFQGQSEILDARTNRFHWTQTAGMILLHPILAKLWKRCGCLVMALRARAFAELHYDPAGFFSEAEHDRFGFVRDVPVQNPKFANDKTLDSFRILTAPADLDEVGPEDEYFLMAAD